jgi:hypothetical protein
LAGQISSKTTGLTRSWEYWSMRVANKAGGLGAAPVRSAPAKAKPSPRRAKAARPKVKPKEARKARRR